MLMNWINNFLNRISMYALISYLLHTLIAVSVILSLFNIIPYTWWHILVTLTILLVTCYISNQAIASIFGIKPNVESQIVTAEILTLIVGPGDPINNWLFLVAIGFIAMASKYLLAINKRHLFNPAAIGSVGTALLLGNSASWWVGNIYMLPIVLIGGFLLVHKLKWFHLFLSFFITYCVLLLALQIQNGNEISSAIISVKDTLVNSGIIFFSTIMLTEPLTAPSRKSNRMIYGIAIAIILIILQQSFTSIYYNLELALVIGNVLGFILTPNPKVTLKLKEKVYYARNSMALTFIPNRELKFLPGQYMQFLLPHEKADARGSRRYFSIASSPTEKEIIIATKFSEESSTYKKHLKEMKTDQTLLAGSLDGEFVLPKDFSKGLVFIAGGVGITPFRSMIKYLIDTGTKADVTLLYANKDPEDIGFTEIFDEAEEKIGLKTVYVLSGKIPDTWSGQKGLITPEMIRKEVTNYESKTYYLSGPDPMVRAFEKMIKEMGIKSNQIVTDYFPGYE